MATCNRCGKSYSIWTAQGLGSGLCNSCHAEPAAAQTPSTAPQVPAFPEKLDVRTVDGELLSSLDRQSIANGLKEGWLRMEDAIQLKDGSWQSIQATLGKADFPIQVLLNCPRAYASRVAIITAVVFGVFNGGGGLLFGTMSFFQVDLIRAIVLLVLFVLTWVVVGGLRNTRGMGAPVILLVSAFIFQQIAGVKGSAFTIAYCYIGMMLGTALAGALGAVPGFLIGYPAGWLTGLPLRRKYQLPAIRTPPPKEAADTRSAPIRHTGDNRQESSPK